MENVLLDCSFNPMASCDTGTDSPHEVAFAPQAAKASNCQYFAVSTKPICSDKDVILLLNNPPYSKTILYVNTQSVSNYGAEAVGVYLAGNVNPNSAECRDGPICQTNLGCSSPSAAKVCWTGLAHLSALRPAEFLTQNIVPLLSTLRIDHQGGFVVTPGKSLAVVVTGLLPPTPCEVGDPNCVNVGIDLSWWETPCNSHA